MMKQQAGSYKCIVLLCSVCCMFSLSLLHAQSAAVGMQAEFNSIARYSSAQTGFEGFQTYSSGIVNGSQFFYPDWARADVATVNNTALNCSDYVFLFDKVRQQLFLRYKDSATVLLADRNLIRSFTLFTDKPHLFCKASQFDPGKKDVFFEILSENDSGYSLLKQVTTRFVKADEHDMQKVKSGENYDGFIDDVTYYLSFKRGITQKMELRNAALRKLFPPSKKDAINAFFERFSDREINESFLSKLVQEMNG